ncbi:MAG: alpha/beta fold hydrolase [[Clostridium] innocuum]|uniref:alpha/beta fold hydrolase n=1 Tax=Clostridium innocuum TaxID=1522 RepID=UPI00038C901E|nr:alpha/beta hydrolase [[Clostridium] innocuum]EQJ62890.1 alpha/beta hydrolase fold family protein [Clostridioides difficile P28]MCI2997165.1 alpha/beta hydrolase [[Clostridium] innocuum]MCR0135875.1 alpha/beta hydrolase [[Clostridium] innocuum]MCR0589140.1 alpha/beta hydrolase [[Clostridium] innocuum]QIX10399.1 alpha/beta hydrolase [[Clostridium] innocuum]
MFYNARNCNIKIDDTDMDYISFGNGNKSLVIIPGLGDALKTVKGTAVTFALMYKLFAKDYKVYVFSRKNKLKQDCSTRDMATDLASVMKQLNITKAFVLGVSQGGMIAQYLAIDYPELVEKLVLAVTLCQPNETSKSVISNWLQRCTKGT